MAVRAGRRDAAHRRRPRHHHGRRRGRRVRHRGPPLVRRRRRRAGRDPQPARPGGRAHARPRRTPPQDARTSDGAGGSTSPSCRSSARSCIRPGAVAHSSPARGSPTLGAAGAARRRSRSCRPPRGSARRRWSPTGSPTTDDRAGCRSIRGDDDPVRFWTYVVAALETVVPELGAEASSLLQDARQPSIDAVVATLLNDLRGRRDGRRPGARRLPRHRVRRDPRVGGLPARPPAAAASAS